MTKITYRFLWPFLVGILFFSGCASQQTQVNQARQLFSSGNLAAASVVIEQAIPSKNTVYNLEQGNLLRLMGTQRLSNSNQQFLQADAVLRQNEFVQANLQSSLANLGSYFLAEGLGKDYRLKGYEGTMLAYSIALNHLLLGDWDSARVEIMKMVQREQDLASFNAMKYQAIAQSSQRGVRGLQATVDNRLIPGNPLIKGYPVQTITDAQTLSLKNSYQSAVAHYLAGFVFEKLREPSLAAPGYRLAIELRPELPFLREGLHNVDANFKNPSNGNAQELTDTLFIVETGFLPKIESFKTSIPIPLQGQLRLATISYPVIAPYTEFFDPEHIEIDDQKHRLHMVTSLDSMARRDLKDEMPGYILRGVSRAVTQILTQIGVQNTLQGNQSPYSNQATLGALASLVTGITLAEINTADVRHWSTMPANIFLTRAQIPSGIKDIMVRTPNGLMVGRPIHFQGEKSIVYIRMFRDRATILASNDGQSPFASITQPIVTLVKNNKPPTPLAFSPLLPKITP